MLFPSLGCSWQGSDLHNALQTLDAGFKRSGVYEVLWGFSLISSSVAVERIEQGLIGELLG